MKACKGSRDTAPVILDPDTGRTEWSTNLPLGKNAGTCRVGCRAVWTFRRRKETPLPLLVSIRINTLVYECRHLTPPYRLRVFFLVNK